jgi:hypothetical protein
MKSFVGAMALLLGVCAFTERLAHAQAASEDVRFGLPAYRLTRDTGHEQTGFDDTSLSRPAFALITLALPTGKHDTGERFIQHELALETVRPYHSDNLLSSGISHRF